MYSETKLWCSEFINVINDTQYDKLNSLSVVS